MISTMTRRTAGVLDGNSFSIGQENLTLAKDSAINIAIKTPAGSKCEAYGEYQCFGGSVKIEVFKGATVADGTPATPTNQNDQSPKTSKCTVLTGVTITDTGTTIRSRTMFSSSTVPAKSNSSVGDDIPRVFDDNVQYVVRLTALDAETAVSMAINWLEK